MSYSFDFSTVNVGNLGVLAQGLLVLHELRKRLVGIDAGGALNLGA